MGIGSPGHVHEGIVKAAANFKAWRNVPLAALLEAALGRPCALANDADAALLAECWVGAASGAGAAPGPGDVAMVTLGSGVGVAAVAGGRLLRGSRGLIEGGHTILSTDPAARTCGCGQRGCAEAYVSANSVRNRFHEARIAAGLVVEDGATTSQMSTAEVFALAGSGSVGGGAMDNGSAVARGTLEEALRALAVEVVEETARLLAVLVVNLCRSYDSRVIVFG